MPMAKRPSIFHSADGASQLEREGKPAANVSSLVKAKRDDGEAARTPTRGRQPMVSMADGAQVRGRRATIIRGYSDNDAVSSRLAELQAEYDAAAVSSKGASEGAAEDDDDIDYGKEGASHVTYATYSQAGHKGDPRIRKVNQDAHVAIPDINGDKSKFLFGVFDGHGQVGEKASALAKDTFVLKFGLSEAAVAMPEEGAQQAGRQRRGTEWTFSDMKQSLLEADDTLMTHKTLDVSMSGTTAVVVYVDGNKLYAANVGDSRAVLATRKGGALLATDLTVDQKPEDELERIEAAGGRVEKMDEDGPARVFKRGGIVLNGVKYEIPGLAMARSIGDAVAKEAGVIAEAVCTKKALEPEDRFMIVASDGVWEFISSQEAVDIVAKSLDKTGGRIVHACDALVEEAARHWAREDEVQDDITAVIACFKQ